MVRVRFAPSPTGYLHIGNARTALFNWLFARANRGSFILRIEDTDIERSKENYVGSIMSDLRWLELDWDEGPDKGGPFAPYRQSERLRVYEKFAEKLLKEEKAYYCYCSDEELKMRRSAALKAGQTPKYDNRCRDLQEEEIEEFKKKKKKPALRFKVPDKRVIIDDIVRGRVEFDTSLIGDFVIMKSTETPSFNFAVVCDDITMEISHIIRGEDHLSNAPKHALLFEALGFKAPQFAHMSLTTAPGGDRLSKRTGATSIAYYRETGYLPEAMVNYLTLLGWSPGDDREILSREEIIKEFKLERLSRSSEALDPNKLDWLSGIYIRKTGLDRLTRLCIPYLKKAKFIKKDAPEADEFDKLREMVAAVRDHLSNISQIKDHVDVFFKDKFAIKDKEAQDILKSAASKNVLKAFLERVEGSNAIDEDLFNNLVKDIQTKTGVKGRLLYQPIRIAITGRIHGPELKLIIPIIGKESCVRRVKRALNS
ncbi:MAG: glutamate--tRNA ligase [Candidatus Omnitrophica bacterium]|nr:glutamate--tRNA ligase [Candidatus Omnitrophota bacterium]